jgi:hypothetical protein
MLDVQALSDKALQELSVAVSAELKKRMVNVSYIRWHRIDLEEVMDSNGVSPTEENVKRFVESKAPRTFEELSIQAGWDLLRELVVDMKNDGVFEAPEEKREA